MAFAFLAVGLAGFGGLLIEFVWVRRFGLLLGNTSESAALVIGAYLLGLGIGGLGVRWLAERGPRPRLAVALYGAVAVTALGLDLFLRALPPLPFVGGLALLPVVPGIPTVLMGVAFPLVFAALGPQATRWQVGGLAAANLAGSLVATAIAANFLIPRIGMSATMLLGSAAYLAAALSLAGTLRKQRSVRVQEPGAPRVDLGWLAVAAVLSGMLIVGDQIFLLRRMPFYLEGFQPTLSAVLAACLLGLTLGSAFGTPLLARLLGDRAVPGALVAAVVWINLGPQEWVAPFSHIRVTSDFAMHGRLWLAALLVAGPACFFLGAVLPLALTRFDDPAARSVAAGRLFFWQGVGSIAGSLLISHLLTGLFPVAYFSVVPMVLGLLSVLLLAPQIRAPGSAILTVAVIASAALGVSGTGPPWAPDPPLALRGIPSSHWKRFIAHRSDSINTASAVYDRTVHSMLLYTNEFPAAATGPGADYMQFLGHLPFLLRDELNEIAVIAFGTGTSARSVTEWESPSTIHFVEISRAVIELSGQYAGAGPLEEPRPRDFLRDPRARVHVTDGRRFLARCEPDTLDLVTMEPLLPYAPGTAYLYTREFYRLASRSLKPDGLLVQWIPTHAVPPDHYESMVATFARSFTHPSLWMLDGATILVGSDTPHVPELRDVARRLEAASETARTSLHEARIASKWDLPAVFVAADFVAAFDGVVDLSDDRPFVEKLGVWKYDGSWRFFKVANFTLLLKLAGRAGNTPMDEPELARLRQKRMQGFRNFRAAGTAKGPRRMALATAADRAYSEARRMAPESTAIYHEALINRRLIAVAALENKRGQALDDHIRLNLSRDPGEPAYQAARSLPGISRDLKLSPIEAARRAAAIKPSFYSNAPEFLRGTLRRLPNRSPLEGLSDLPAPGELADLVAEDDPLGTALRAAYRVRSALALIEVLKLRRLSGKQQRALGPLLDPALFESSRDAITARHGDAKREIDALGRPDLAPSQSAPAPSVSGRTPGESLQPSNDRAAALLFDSAEPASGPPH
jgi:spermidine synthase